MFTNSLDSIDRSLCLRLTGDSAFLVNIFTQDAKVFPPNSDVVIGRPAIAVVNSQYLKLDIKEFREETFAFYGNEDYLIDEGNYYFRYGKDNTIDKGKYLNVSNLSQILIFA